MPDREISCRLELQAKQRIGDVQQRVAHSLEREVLADGRSGAVASAQLVREVLDVAPGGRPAENRVGAREIALYGRFGDALQLVEETVYAFWRAGHVSVELVSRIRWVAEQRGELVANSQQRVEHEVVVGRAQILKALHRLQPGGGIVGVLQDEAQILRTDDHLARRATALRDEPVGG